MRRILPIILGAVLLTMPLAQAQRPAIWGPVSPGSAWPPPSEQYQSGSTNLVASTQSYAVSFGTPMSSAPAVIIVQVYMADADGAILFANVRTDTVTANGFTFVLSGLPPASAGSAKWTAQL